MSEKIMTMRALVTGGKSYKAHKYGLDHADRPFIDYGEDSIIVMKTAETNKSNRKYVPLEDLSKKISSRDEQLLTYFLDGSRRVFKVDDIIPEVEDRKRTGYESGDNGHSGYICFLHLVAEVILHMLIPEGAALYTP